MYFIIALQQGEYGGCVAQAAIHHQQIHTTMSKVENGGDQGVVLKK